MFSNQVFRVIRCAQSSLNHVKRSAGHSKWANIRHIKAAKDSEKSGLILRKLREIRIALASNGWVCDPVQSSVLARAINSALAANIPKDTVDNYLKKMKASAETTVEYRLRGPRDTIFIITFSCSAAGKNDLAYNVKRLVNKSSILQVTQGFQQAFEKKGIILAKHMVKEAKADDAEEAAILAGAEEVRPEDGEENVYRFMTEAKDMGQVAKELKEVNWEVLSASIEELPTYLVEIPEEELPELVEEIEKFQDLPEFLKIVDNVAQP